MLFFYNIIGDDMKLYIDLILILNFFIDFILLLSVSIILKRNSSFYRIILSSFLASFSIFLLFIKINSIELFLFKIIISIFMVLIAFGFKNIKYFITNFAFLYINSIVLGGFIYFINLQFSTDKKGLIFINNGFSINFLFLIIFSPIIIYIYIKQIKKLKNNYSNYYEVNLFINKKVKKCVGYLDTGNNLVDPITNKPVILINKKSLDYNPKNFMLVPFKGINNNGLLKCIKLSKIEIKGHGVYKNLLLGIIEDNYKFEGVDVILNKKIMEGIYDKKIDKYDSKDI